MPMVLTSHARLSSLVCDGSNESGKNVVGVAAHYLCSRQLLRKGTPKKRQRPGSRRSHVHASIVIQIYSTFILRRKYIGVTNVDRDDRWYTRLGLQRHVIHTIIKILVLLKIRGFHVARGRKAWSSIHQRNSSIVVMSTHQTSTETFESSQLDLPLCSYQGGEPPRKGRTVSSSCSRRLIAIASAGD
jgi:hypothetical protein